MKITRPEYNYSILFHEDDTLYMVIKTEDDVLEFDGRNGNLMDASDFEAHFSEEAQDMTLEEIIYGTTEYLKDLDIDEEAIRAIIKDLTPWFEEYVIEEPKPDAWLKVLEQRVEELKGKEERHRNAIPAAIERFREWVSTADEYSIIDDAELRAKKVTEVRETYRAVWQELKKAESELWNYMDTMHIR